MIINITDEQMIKMAKLAVLYSEPMGLGYLHYRPMKIEDITEVKINNGGIFIDYYEGRMVKFQARKIEDGKWDVNERTSYDYQSWKKRFDSYLALALEVINND